MQCPHALSVSPHGARSNHVIGRTEPVPHGDSAPRPLQHLVIPSFKPPGHYSKSPLLGHPPMARDILLYFRGDTGAYRLDQYSRGVRQKLYK